MKDVFSYDVVIKDLFQKDRPGLMDSITGGKPAVEFL